MPKYVDAEKYSEKLSKVTDYGRESESTAVTVGWESAIDKAMDILEDMPAADVTPVVHGKWEHTGTRCSSQWRCTVCGGIAHYPFRGRKRPDFKRLPCTYKFCPNCGAKMRMEE